MNKYIKTLITLALVASVLIFLTGFVKFLPSGVKVDGVAVGGLTRTAAEQRIRGRLEERLKDKELIIYADERRYGYRFPEFYYADNLEELLGSIRRRGEYFSDTKVYLNGEEEVIGGICADVERAAVEPYALFNRTGEPFTYCEGRDGVKIDTVKLSEDINLSLNSGFEPVYARLNVVERTQTMQNVKRGTVKISAFSTYFDGSNLPRTANIRLASSKINGTVLLPGESFSFNDIVGARTLSNGFQFAKIISGGEFVDGVGGGVCQVSTTVYNAAVLAGMQITEYHPHSLQVSYVAPSRDAMVSGTYFDLKFTNTAKTPVYVRMNADFSGVYCTFYGTDDGIKRTFFSKKVGEIAPPEDRIVEGDEDKIIAKGREGTLSEGYVTEERGGRIITRLIRRDKYGAVGAVRQVRKGDTSGEGTDEGSAESTGERSVGGGQSEQSGPR
ncbi:MAG: VanW family protein [Candidatus Coproplasma sp.]